MPALNSRHGRAYVAAEGKRRTKPRLWGERPLASHDAGSCQGLLADTHIFASAGECLTVVTIILAAYPYGEKSALMKIQQSSPARKITACLLPVVGLGLLRASGD